ncbi:MAG: tRNA (adenosine(37)-N6)-threonylcarbamoyltransferase complex transferase subunit TsaD [Terracidiphilus sp.]|nr:tRNA (adenosine(37)-N6)-threonylcarbamoyltransferase complex transferase subunit TsaD [Terracidiphilus sp.]
MTRGLILAIESSCDETAAAVVERGSRTLSSVVASQIPTHARYGGVVPELASREHLRAIVPVVRAALAQANITLDDLDAIAVTSGPGLAGALLVGITYAKALAFAQNIPLIAINHLEGHIHAVLLHERESAQPETTGAGAPGLASETWDTKDLHSPLAPPDQPALALVVSGGHTHLFLARPAHGAWTYKLIGRTVDDAAGEAYDKVAKLLGFGYPGGPWIDALARYGNPRAVPFAFSQIKTKLHLAGRPPRTKAALTAPIANLNPHFLFSFSGIKTAVLRYVELHNLREESHARAARLFPQQYSRPEPSIDACHPERAKRTGVPSDRSSSLGWGVEGPAFPSLSTPQAPGAPGLASETWETTNPETPRPPTTKAEALALCPQPTLDLIASFQHAVVGDLMKKTFAAAESLGVRRILVTGGVAANRELRARFTAEAARRHVRVAFPTLSLSTDNAAMIGAAAWPRLQAKEFAGPSLSADPSLALGR